MVPEPPTPPLSGPPALSDALPAAAPVAPPAGAPPAGDPGLDEALAWRLAFEMRELAKFFPELRWYKHRGAIFTEGPLRTNGGTPYAVRVVLPDDFPSGIPTLLLTHPKGLRNAHGDLLTDVGVSGPMHLLRPVDGLPRLCHHRPDEWTPTRTVYQVVVKARLWLEAYELHLAHGSAIDRWLPHVRR